MKKNCIFVSILMAMFATSPMLALAQTANTASNATASEQNDADTQAEADAEEDTQADAKADAAAAAKADAKVALEEFKAARTAVRQAKTEDASAADVDVVRTAAADGNTSAMVVLADYLLSRDAAAAITQYEAAAAADDTRGLVGLARAYWAGKFVEKNREKAATFIKQAVEADNKVGIITYARWLPTLDKENGATQSISLLESKVALLGAEKVAPLLAEMKLKGKLSFSMRDAVADLLASLPENKRDTTILSTLRQDQNLYVWLMQDVLTKRNHYSGARNGLLTSSTVQGFASLCSELDISANCVRGPLNRESAQAVTKALRAQAN
jgi:TPR repeat protein